jgi:hypothetical protein
VTPDPKPVFPPNRRICQAQAREFSTSSALVEGGSPVPNLGVPPSSGWVTAFFPEMLEFLPVGKRFGQPAFLTKSRNSATSSSEDNVPLGPRELRVALHEHRASIHGLTFGDVGFALLAANDGTVPSTFKDPDSDEDVDTRVLLREDQRRTIAGLGGLTLRRARPSGSGRPRWRRRGRRAGDPPA